MHYNWNHFAVDETKPTVTDKNGNKVGTSEDFTLVQYFFLPLSQYTDDSPKIKNFYCW